MVGTTSEFKKSIVPAAVLVKIPTPTSFIAIIRPIRLLDIPASSVKVIDTLSLEERQDIERKSLVESLKTPIRDHTTFFYCHNMSTLPLPSDPSPYPHFFYFDLWLAKNRLRVQSEMDLFSHGLVAEKSRAE